MRNAAEILTEILKLSSMAKDYDTDLQSNDTCVAAGAHDALRWVLGLVENSIADSFGISIPDCPDSPDGKHHTMRCGSAAPMLEIADDCYYCGEKAGIRP